MEFRKHAYLLAMIESLQSSGSWTGKTHVQKAVFFLQEATTTDSLFKFVLYKHGPYSFDIEDELEQMRSYAAIVVQPISGFGVALKPDTNEAFVKSREPLTAAEVSDIKMIAAFVGTKSVTTLEQQATVVWVRNHNHITDGHEVARRVHELKPHISIDDALTADQEVMQNLNLRLVAVQN